MVETVSKRSSTGRALLWGGAAGLSCIAHIGAAALIFQEPPEALPSDGAPPAIMIELAALPETVNVDETEIGEAAQNTEEIEEQPEPEEVVEPEPDEQAIETPEVESKNAVAAIRPVLRPERKEQPKKEPRKQVRQKRAIPRAEPQQAQTRAASEAQPSERTAAPQEAAGQRTSNISPARWQSRLMAHLERRKRYPNAAKMRREQGTAYVNFTIDERGNVLSVSLARSSGFAELDQAVLDLLRRASPVPAPPPGVNRNIVAPIRFTIR